MQTRNTGSYHGHLAVKYTNKFTYMYSSNNICVFGDLINFITSINADLHMDMPLELTIVERTVRGTTIRKRNDKEFIYTSSRFIGELGI